MEMRTVLAIAASDPSAGAGAQQDLKTITALGHYGLTALTALTAQNTRGVSGVSPVPAPFFRAQLAALLADIPVDAVKIGVVPTRAIAVEIARALSPLRVPVVLDPVIASTSGWRFMRDEGVLDCLVRRLFPLCTLVTPNIPEAARLLGQGRTARPADMGRTLARRHGTAFLVKGGHTSGPESTDLLCTPDGEVRAFASPRVRTRNLHGTGCTLSSAIAALLAQGLPLAESVGRAKALTLRGIERGRGLRVGSGNGPLWLFPAPGE